MSYADVKYLNMISLRLRNFKKKNHNLWQFSCPLCGDSTKNKLKSRGYIYQKKGQYFYRCHNCGIGTTFANFLKQVSPEHHREFIKESFAGRGKGKPLEEEEVKTGFQKREKIDLLSIKELHNNHPAKAYLIKRQIPEKFFSKLFYTDNIEKWTNTKKKVFEEPRSSAESIIIPFYNSNRELVGYQGRMLNDKYRRYVSIRLIEDCDMIYGLERIDFNETIYIVEGPFDSLFIPNCVALRSAVTHIPADILDENNFVMVLDNEPRGREITKHLRKMIEKDFKVCIWDDRKEKDINEMVLSGISQEDIFKTIKERTFFGPEALLEFSRWTKCKQ